MKKEKIEYKKPTRINESMLDCLARVWADKEYRDFMINLRNSKIRSLKDIKEATIEAFALKNARVQGEISLLEDHIFQMIRAYEKINTK